MTTATLSTDELIDRILARLFLRGVTVFDSAAMRTLTARQIENTLRKETEAAAQIVTLSDVTADTVGADFKRRRYVLAQTPEFKIWHIIDRDAL